MYLGNLQYRPSRNRHNQQSGYMLVVLIFLMVGLMLAALWTAPAIATAIQRDKETEMIHRGVQYTRAIQKYYKKFGRYPATLEALEDTNHLRFLRKRYKDPFSPDGKWQVVRFGQVNFNAANRQGGAAAPLGAGGAALPNVPGVTGLIQGQQGSIFNNQPQPNTSGVSGNVPGLGSSSMMGQPSSFAQPGQPTAVGPGSAQDQASQTGNNQSAFGQSNTGPGGGQVLGGGAIIGVASMSGRKSLRVVNDKDHYKDWKFVYDPTLDRGGQINGPYDPTKQLGKFAGANSSQGIGQPIGSQQQGSSFNNNSTFNNNSSFGNSGSSFGQPIQPQHPPDMNAPNPQ